MPRYMARAVYTLTTPDGREVGTLYEARTNRLAIGLDPAFHKTECQRSGTTGEPLPRLVVHPVPRGDGGNEHDAS